MCHAEADTVGVTGPDGSFDLPAVSRRVVDFVPVIGVVEAPPQRWATCFVTGTDTLTSQNFLWPPRAEALMTCEVKAATDSERCEVEGWMRYVDRMKTPTACHEAAEPAAAGRHRGHVRLCFVLASAYPVARPLHCVTLYAAERPSVLQRTQQAGRPPLRAFQSSARPQPPARRQLPAPRDAGLSPAGGPSGRSGLRQPPAGHRQLDGCGLVGVVLAGAVGPRPPCSASRPRSGSPPQTWSEVAQDQERCELAAAADLRRQRCWLRWAPARTLLVSTLCYQPKAAERPTVLRLPCLTALPTS